MDGMVSLISGFILTPTVVAVACQQLRSHKNSWGREPLSSSSSSLCLFSILKKSVPYGSWCCASIHGILGSSLYMSRRRLEMPISHPRQAFLCKCFRNPAVLTLCKFVFNKFSVCSWALWANLSTVKNTQNITNLWPSFYQSRTCALQFYSNQKFSGTQWSLWNVIL